MEQERSASRWGKAVFEFDLLVKEIMVWLPARHLRRLSVVEKRWRTLTCNPNFLHRHSFHHCINNTSEAAFIIITQLRLLHFNPTTRALVPFDFTLSPLTTILQSSHGLMLFECRDSRQGPTYYCVANPTTKRARKLLIKQDPLKTSEKIVPLFLDYDPSESEYYRVGFLRIVAGNHTLDVYDSRSHAWNQRSCPDTFGLPSSYAQAYTRVRICLGNRVYCVGGYGAILYVDLDEELNCGMMWIPSIFDNRSYVMEWGGTVYCISIYWRSEAETHVMIVQRLLECYGGEWAWGQFLRVDLNLLGMKAPICVLGIVGGHNDDELSILFTGGGKILVYRMLDHTFEILFHFRPLYLLGAHHFRETLSLV